MAAGTGQGEAVAAVTSAVVASRDAYTVLPSRFTRVLYTYPIQDLKPLTTTRGRSAAESDSFNGTLSITHWVHPHLSG